MDASDELLERLPRDGFSRLTDAQPVELADYLEDQAASTGMSAPLFISQSLRAVDELHREHDKYGGVRVGFLNLLDDLARTRLPRIHRSEPHVASSLARDFRNDVLDLVQKYDPANTYEP